MEGGAGMRKEAQTELKDAARNNQRARGEHPHRAGGQAGQVSKNTPWQHQQAQQSWEKHRDRFFPVMLRCCLSFTALARQNTHCCTG